MWKFCLPSSFLDDNKYAMRTTLTLKTVTIGIPQGSILGALLFLLFINDLPEILTEFSTYGHGDDFKAIVLNQDQLNSTTAKLEQWLDHNRMLPTSRNQHSSALEENCQPPWW